MLRNPVEHTLILNSGRQPGANRHPRWSSDRLHTTPLPQDHTHILAANTDKTRQWPTKPAAVLNPYFGSAAATRKA
jgi:hypothetical protein